MRRPVKNRIIPEADVKYGDLVIGRLINYVMKSGNKSAASKIVYGALEEIEKKTGKPAIEVFNKAIENASPNMELRSRRIGGANYQVPIEVRPERKLALALRWILESARSQKGKPMHTKLAQELMAAANNEGNAIKKKNDTHRMAEANKAFAHFAW